MQVHHHRRCWSVGYSQARCLARQKPPPRDRPSRSWRYSLGTQTDHVACGDPAMAGNVRNRSRIACRLLRSEEHASELQSLMRISYAVFCLKKKNIVTYQITNHPTEYHECHRYTR